MGLYAIWVWNWNWWLTQDHFLIKHWSQRTHRCSAVRCWPWGVFIGAGQQLQHGEVRDTNLAWVRPVINTASCMPHTYMGRVNTLQWEERENEWANPSGQLVAGFYTAQCNVSCLTMYTYILPCTPSPISKWHDRIRVLLCAVSARNCVMCTSFGFQIWSSVWSSCHYAQSIAMVDTRKLRLWWHTRLGDWLIEHKQLWAKYLCMTSNMSWRPCAVTEQSQSNSVQTSTGYLPHSRRDCQTPCSKYAAHIPCSGKFQSNGQTTATIKVNSSLFHQNMKLKVNVDLFVTF